MDSPQSELSIDQRFQLRSFELQVSKMSHEQAQAMAIEVYRTMLVKDAMYRDLLRRDLVGEFCVGPDTQGCGE